MLTNKERRSSFGHSLTAARKSNKDAYRTSHPVASFDDKTHGSLSRIACNSDSNTTTEANLTQVAGVLPPHCTLTGY